MMTKCMKLHKGFRAAFFLCDYMEEEREETEELLEAI